MPRSSTIIFGGKLGCRTRGRRKGKRGGKIERREGGRAGGKQEGRDGGLRRREGGYLRGVLVPEIIVPA